MNTYETAKVYDTFEVLDLLANDLLADEIYKNLIEHRMSADKNIELGEVCHLLIHSPGRIEICTEGEFREFNSFWFTRGMLRKVAGECAEFCSEKYLSFLSD